MAAKKIEKERIEKGRAWAYLRVSTDGQDNNNQRLEILRVAQERGLGAVQFVEEVVSGRKSWHDRRLRDIMDQMNPGDALLVAEISRLGRSMLEVMEILSQCAERRIHVYAAKGNWALDDSLPSKIVASVLAMAAEIERELISQRTKSALATKRAAGVVLGRPRGPGASKLDPHADEIRELISLGVPVTKIAKRFGSSVPNLRVWMKKRRPETTETGPAIVAE
jgi:DNA invertase Pin-like site-specific DNA recombinase